MCANYIRIVNRTNDDYILTRRGTHNKWFVGCGNAYSLNLPYNCNDATPYSLERAHHNRPSSAPCRPCAPCGPSVPCEPTRIYGPYGALEPCDPYSACGADCSSGLLTRRNCIEARREFSETPLLDICQCDNGLKVKKLSRRRRHRQERKQKHEEEKQKEDKKHEDKHEEHKKPEEAVYFWLNVNGEIGRVETTCQRNCPLFARTSIKLQLPGFPTCPQRINYLIQPPING